MRRGYVCAFFLAVLFACIQTTGCGGGSGTAKLLVTTTSLPGGLVGTPYSASLTATGGTPGYTWAQVSGGAMPSGISLGTSGVFNGTPTAPGTFGPYVFKVTDSASLVASSVGMSITVKPSTLTVVTTALPQGTVNASYSFALAASGGAAPITWAVTSGGTLPPGLAISSTGVISGTPTSAGSYGPYVFTATDSSNATAVSGSLTFTIISAVTASCAPAGNEAALTATTPYAFLVEGTDGSGKPIDIAGSFTPDGKGGITDASVDYNGFSNGPQQLQVNFADSSYSFGSTTIGCLYLVFTGQAPAATTALRGGTSPHFDRGQVVLAKDTREVAAASQATTVSNAKFSFSLGGFDGTVYHTGRIIEFDSLATGTNASGFIHLQTPSTFSVESLQPNFAFGFDGWTAVPSGFARTAIAGSFLNSSGTLSTGYADLNNGGTPTGFLTGGTGTLSSAVDAGTGRGTGTYTVPITGGNLSFDFAFYILDGSDLILISTDSPIAVGSAPLLAGRILASSASYAAGAVNGYYIAASQGLVVNGTSVANLAQVGTFNAADGAVPQAVFYLNNAGSYSATPYFNGTYTLDPASGRVQLSGLTSSNPIVYLTAGATSDDEIAGFLVGSDSAVSSGTVVFQSTASPAYLTSDISGTYAFSTEADLDGLNGAVGGTFSFPGTGKYTSTQNTTTPGNTGQLSAPPPSGFVSINSDGSGSISGGNFPLVTNGNVIFAIPKSGDPLLYVFTTGTVPN